MHRALSQMTASRSMTAIAYLAEDALADTANDELREGFQRIIEAASLDEAHAIAHDMLGQHDLAEDIRRARAARKARAKRVYDSGLLLGVV